MACAGCENGDPKWSKTHTRQRGVCGAFIPATKATNVDSSAEVMSGAGFEIASSSLFSKAKAASASQPRVKTVFNDDPAADEDGELSVAASNLDDDLRGFAELEQEPEPAAPLALRRPKRAAAPSGKRARRRRRVQAAPTGALPHQAAGLQGEFEEAEEVRAHRPPNPQEKRAHALPGVSGPDQARVHARGEQPPLYLSREPAPEEEV